MVSFFVEGRTEIWGVNLMKIRQGFVSNNSSSSFIIAFDRKPESPEELKNILFGPEKVHCVYGRSASTQEIADEVFGQLKSESPLTLDQIIDELMSGYIPEIYINDYRNAPKEWIKDPNNWKCPDDQVFFRVEFEDDNNLGCICEHGGIFCRIHAIQISHH